MHCYNGLGAAERIGISYKTLLRWIEKGKITPEEGKTPTGQLVISGDQVEAARREIQRERDTFKQSQSVSLDEHRQTETDIDMERRLASMAQSIANLNATVANQTRRIGELAARVAQLEGQASLGSPRQSAPPLPTSDIPPIAKPAIRTTDASSLPDGCVLARDFARIHSVAESSFRRHIASGIGNDRVEAGSSKHGRYLTPEQQEKALEFWIRHNVKFTRAE